MLLRRFFSVDVEIGGVSKATLRAALAEAGVQLNAAAEALFADPRFTVAPQRQPIRITALSVADLGLTTGATAPEIAAAARARGWSDCPLELGSHLCLRRVLPPEAADARPPTPGTAPPGAFTIASAPLDDDDETPKGFYLRRVDGVDWLRGYRSWDGHPWHPDDVFVFCQRAP
jgi:hypothetical protein